MTQRQFTREEAAKIAKRMEARGKTTPCCECGNEYPLVENLDGEVFCAACRLAEAKRLTVALKEQRDSARGAIRMAVDRLGGTVEGRPTHEGNFLQRIDELVALEEAINAVGKAGDEAAARRVAEAGP